MHYLITVMFLCIFSADCYAGINMAAADRHQREDFSLWPPVQVCTVALVTTHMHEISDVILQC